MGAVTLFDGCSRTLPLDQYVRAGTRVTMSDTGDGRRPRATGSNYVALCKTSTFSRTTLHLLYGPQNKNDSAP